jgi:ribonuclease HII
MIDLLKFEKEYLARGCKYIAGVDEAGRGPLAGPVACAAVIMPLEKDKIIAGINDSKQLSEKVREKLYKEIIQIALCYKVVFIDHKTIDLINILNAAKRGMKEAAMGLPIKPDIALIDAVKLDLPFESLSIIKGDTLSYSIAAASIIAKVERDRLMREYDKQYPQYKFAEHKGYATAKHRALVQKFGKCEIHRESFLKKLETEIRG